MVRLLVQLTVFAQDPWPHRPELPQWGGGDLVRVVIAHLAAMLLVGAAMSALAAVLSFTLRPIFGMVS